jgi:prephenate dehydrogenase
MYVPTLTVVGVGLLGGSIALAARQRRIAGRIVGCDRSEDVLQRAGNTHMLDAATTDLEDAVRDADLVVFCTPVDRIAAQVVQAASVCRPGVILTDVGSTKSGIVRALAGKLPPGATFIGSHPLAGSEKTGPEHARADLLENRLVVVTPVEVHPGAVARLMAFWHALGASVMPMLPEEHDRALAMTSHLPHVVASALAGVLPEHWRWLTATGFRDTTRIAAGSPEMWQAIFLANRESILEALDRYRDRLDRYREALAAGDADAILQLWLEGKQVRDSLSPRS